MSEQIDCNLSLGVAESGKIGDDILIGILSIDKEDELKLILNNLLFSTNLIGFQDQLKSSAEGSDLFERKSMAQKYIAKLIRDQAIKIILFRFKPREQFKIIHETSILEGKKLYEIAKAIDSSNFQYIAKSLQLRYQFPKNYIDTFIKSMLQYFSLDWFIKQQDCGHAELFKENILEERKMAIHIIVNGGAQFSSYQDLLNDNLKNFWSTMKTKESSRFYWNLMVATHGIANAHYWYPVVASIDFIVSELQSTADRFFYSDKTLIDITADELLNQSDIIGKSMVEILHEHYIERTGSTFRPPKLWRVGRFDKLGEYRRTLPYLMLLRSIREKRITAREVDDEVGHIERFYQYNNPLERDCFLVGEITEEDLAIIETLKEVGIEGKTILDEGLLEEYRLLLSDLSNFVQSDECIISKDDQTMILERIAEIEKNDFKIIDEIQIQDIF